VEAAAEQHEAADELERLEVELLLEAIHRRYGFDFREYAKASLKRRLWRRVAAERLTSISGLQERVLHDPACMERLLLDLSINVTSTRPSTSRSASTRSRSCARSRSRGCG
jgi:chemotaxis protein methyltransferase CheR